MSQHPYDLNRSAPAHRKICRTGTLPFEPAKRSLDDPILERMKGDHTDPSYLAECLDRVIDESLQPRKLLIGRDSQSLKGQRRRIDPISPLRLGFPDDFGQLRSRLDRRLDSCLDDRSSDLSSHRLLTVLPKNPRQLVQVQRADQIGRRRPLSAHAHIERPLETKREAARCVIELHRGNPEVGQNDLRLLHFGITQNFNERFVAPLNETNTTSKLRQPLSRPLQSARVTVDPEKPRAGIRLQQRLGMPPQPHRRINDPTIVVTTKKLHDLLQKNRLMTLAILQPWSRLNPVELELLEIVGRKRGRHSLLYPLLVPDDEMILIPENNDVFADPGNVS